MSKHEAPVSKAQIRALEALHTDFARKLSVHYTDFMGAVVDADIAFVDQTTYAEFMESLSNPSCSYTFTIEPLGGPAVLDYSLPIAFAFTNRSSGGEASASKQMEAHVLTPEERPVMAKILTQNLADLEAIWEPTLKIQVRDAELETDPESIRMCGDAVQPGDWVILIAFEINMQFASGLVSLCYPYKTLESAIPNLDA